MKRFSVLYLLREQYQHIACETHSEAESILKRLSSDPRRIPVGIYDAKTELVEWEPARQYAYNQADISEQGQQASQVITIAQALRRRDSSWFSLADSRRPSLFA